MQLRHLRYFVAVGEEESFNKGAERLHVSQPTVWQQIRDLEEELGTPLFERLPRGVRLSDKGRTFLADVKQILEELELACRKVRSTDRQFSPLRVGYPPHVGRTHYVLEQVRAFKETFSDLEVELVCMRSIHQYEALAKGSLDIGFCYDNCAADRELVSVHLETYPIVLMLPATHRLAKQKKISVSELVDEPFVQIVRFRAPLDIDRIAQACERAGFHPRVVKEVEELSDLTELVADGTGLTLGKIYAGSLPQGLVQRPVAEIQLEFHFDLVWRRNDKSVQLARFMESIGHPLA